MDELISIIIPIYNVEPYLQRCITSVRNQTYRNIEIVLVDDGSSDNSLNICNENAIQDNRIKVIHKENGGLSDARNVGIELSKGKYLIFVDSDDYVDSNMILEMYKRIKLDKSDMVICDIEIIDESDVKSTDRLTRLSEGNNSIIYSEEEFWKNAYNALSSYYIVAWNKLYKREVFSSLRFPKGKIHEDEYIMHLVVERCNKISCMNDKFYNYVQRDNSITGSSYTVKRLDIVNALLDRAKYFKDKGMQELSLRTMVSCMRQLRIAYELLDLSDTNILQQYRQHKKSFNKMYKYINTKGKKNTSIVRIRIFMFSEKLYVFLSSRYDKHIKHKKLFFYHHFGDLERE